MTDYTQRLNKNKRDRTPRESLEPFGLSEARVPLWVPKTSSGDGFGFGR
jgi:hypothetical protein